MKLHPFNWWDHYNNDISCGTVALSVITGRKPKNLMRDILEYRRTHPLRPNQGKYYKGFEQDREFTYWHEALHFARKFVKKSRTVWAKYQETVESWAARHKKGSFLVIVHEHMLVLKNGRVYDTRSMGGDITYHIWRDRQMVGWIKLCSK